MANWSMTIRSILIGSLSGPDFRKYGPLRWTTGELISPNSFNETLNKRKLFSIKQKQFPYVWLTISVKRFAKWPENCKYMLNFGASLCQTKFFKSQGGEGKMGTIIETDRSFLDFCSSYHKNPNNLD